MTTSKATFWILLVAVTMRARDTQAEAPEHGALLVEIAPGASYFLGRASYDGPVLALTPSGVTPGSYHSGFNAVAPGIDMLIGFWPARSWAAGLHLGALGGAGFMSRPDIPGAPAHDLLILTAGGFVRWHASLNGFVEGRVGVVMMGIEGGVSDDWGRGEIEDTDALTHGLWGPRGEAGAGWNFISGTGFNCGPRASLWGAYAASQHGALAVGGLHLGFGLEWM